MLDSAVAQDNLLSYAILKILTLVPSFVNYTLLYTLKMKVTGSPQNAVTLQNCLLYTYMPESALGDDKFGNCNGYVVLGASCTQ